ncbi:MAG: transketolase [Clostridiales bacterium]|nr:transketolase [Clostridiales bacterium]
MTIQNKCVNAVRILSAEAVERAKSGHPGMCLGAAPIGYEVFADFLNFSYKNPHWDNRDRFILSAGHGSMLLYSLLHLFGYNVTKEDLMNFRQFGSKTPGHPEYGVTDGVETSTGLLGQGLATAVGFAVAEAHLASIFNRPNYNVVDHYTYVLCGDGCLEEGISYEACSFAGTQKLGKLILLYDRNSITIEGDISTAFTEDPATRFAAQGWQVIRVPDANDLTVLKLAIERAKQDLSRPSVIICTTHIGYGSPLADKASIHGAPLGEENLKRTKRNLGWTEEPFEVPEDVKKHCLEIAENKLKAEEKWNALFARYQRVYPELAKKYESFMKGYEIDFTEFFKNFDFSAPEATRSSGGKILNEIAKLMPNLMSGSADLAPSTKTELKNKGYFAPDYRAGCNIRFGVREHAMAAISNGIQLHGGLKIACSTFFSFTDYMKGGMRISALMNIPVLYVLTHDSIGVGEDGPSHQPMEHLIALRSIPNIKVFRPCDGKETIAAFVSAFTQNSPTAIILSRHSLNQHENSGLHAVAGGYILSDCIGTPDVILMGTGSEVDICTGAQKLLADEGIKARVVSMPCIEEFEKQTDEYKEHVLPKDIKARVCVEAGSHYSWYKYSGDCGEIVAMNSFGSSAPAEKLFEHYGFTKENVAEAAKRSINKAKSKK